MIAASLMIVLLLLNPISCNEDEVDIEAGINMYIIIYYVQV